ncbi:MAG TPA: VWA domain-containing protein, partial [Anaerolineae bacterium]|nr:VWA domain-containing protein [Anaerolineae bacterium]
MSFGKPYFLLGLALLPILWLFLFWAGQSRERALARLGDSGLIGKLAESLNQRGRRWQQRLWLLAIGLIIFALARPQWGTSTQVVQQEGIQIMVALDVSASMLAQDLQPDRLTRAKQTISELMDQLNGDQIGLVLFSGASFIQFPLTNDYATAKSFLSSANPSMISRPGTVIAQAIRTARQGFDDTRSSQKVIVIMTDGENQEGDVLAEAQAAADEDIIIYTLGFGSAEGEPIPNFDRFGNVAGYKQDETGQVILSRLDEETLRQIAEATGGNYFRASASGSEIVTLAELIDQLESAELESRFEVQAIERFPLFLFIAIVCLVIAELIPERRKRARRNYEQLVGMLLVTFLLVGCASEKPAQLIAQGNQQFEQAAYDEALASYSEVRAAGIDSAEPIYNTANVQYRQEQFPEAALTLDEALLRADGDLSAEAWFNLGNTFYAQQEWEQAVEAYKAAL